MRYAKVFSIVPKLIILKAKDDQKGIDHALFSLFSSLGGIYVKFLQIIFSNTKLLDSIDPLERMKVFAESRPDVIDHHIALKRELGMQRYDRLTMHEDKPFASGSFANVYQGYLDGDKPVIIKIKRPGINWQLRKDMLVLGFIIRIVSSFKDTRLELASVAKEYVAGVKRELDYRNEVKNAEMMHFEYQNHPSIVIPVTYGDMCTNNVIVQEQLHGYPLSEVMKHQEQAPQIIEKWLGSDIRKQLRALGLDVLDRSFAGKNVHGDPHPGNIMLLRDNKIGLIDFGLIAGPANDTEGYIDYMREQVHLNAGNFRPGKFAVATLRTYSVRLWHALKVIDDYMSDVKLLHSLEEALDARFYKMAPDPQKTMEKMQQGYTTELFDSVINPGNTLNLQGEMDGMLMRRACHTIWSTIIKFGFYRELIPGIYEEAVGRAQGSGVNKYNKVTDIDHALSIVGEWMTTVREEDPVFYMRVREMLPVDRLGGSSKNLA